MVLQWGHVDLQEYANGSFVSKNNIFTILFFNTFFHKQINKILITAFNETFRQSLDPVYAHTPIRNIRELRIFNPKLGTSPEAKSMTSFCYVSIGPLHPTNLVNQNEVNITQCYSQMNGTNKPEWASVLLFWSMYTFSWIAIKHFLLDLTWLGDAITEIMNRRGFNMSLCRIPIKIKSAWCVQRAAVWCREACVALMFKIQVWWATSAHKYGCPMVIPGNSGQSGQCSC